MARAPVAFIAITTRNRPQMLRRLVDQIRVEAKGVMEPRIHVYDDATPASYGVDDQVRDCHYTLFQDNHGRDFYWVIVDHLFKDARSFKWDYFIMLPDDVTLADNFFERVLCLWEGGSCLSFNTDHRTTGSQWTGRKSVVMGEVILTHWMDLCFICDHVVMERLRWEVLPARRGGESSGVGSQLSRRLFMLGIDMYHTATPLVHHGTHESQMHPYVRKHTPLEH